MPTLCGRYHKFVKCKCELAPIGAGKPASGRQRAGPCGSGQGRDGRLWGSRYSSQHREAAMEPILGVSTIPRFAEALSIDIGMSISELIQASH
jgi:hypothetical protein